MPSSLVLMVMFFKTRFLEITCKSRAAWQSTKVMIKQTEYWVKRKQIHQTHLSLHFIQNMCNLVLFIFSQFCPFSPPNSVFSRFHYFHRSVFSVFFTLDRRLYFHATCWQYNSTKIWHMKFVWNLFALRIWVNWVKFFVFIFFFWLC